MLLKHPMDLGEFIWWMGHWLYMGCWVRINNKRNWWSTTEAKMYVPATSILNKFMSTNRFEGILGYLNYTDKTMLNIIMGSSVCTKWKNNGNLNFLNSLIHHGLTCWKHYGVLF